MEKKPHPAKGKTRAQYEEECRLNRLQREREEREDRLKAERLREYGWDEEAEVFKVLMSYRGGGYSFKKFGEDLDELDKKKQAIAEGKAYVP